MKSEIAQVLEKALGATPGGKTFLEYIGMSIGGQAQYQANGAGGGPADDLCSALRDIASAIRELAEATRGAESVQRR